MFSSLGNILFQKRNLVNSLEYLSLIRSISGGSISENLFTISYLIDNCGLSQEKAISISKKVQFDSPTNPDSVLTLLRNNGFSNSHISKITAGYPGLLLSSAHNTLQPKFDFFNSKGLFGPDLAKVLSREATVLMSSLENTIIPSFDFIKSIVGTDEKVVFLLKRSMNSVIKHKTQASNIKLLRAHGVPDTNIAKLLASQPSVLSIASSRFINIVEDVKKMNFDPSQYMFLIAIHGLAAMSRSSLEAKFGVYKSWGLSEDQVQHAFRKNPYCMMLSEENIMSTMDFYVNKLGYAPLSIAKQPTILQYSCERRIIPRCLAIQLLIKNGQVEKASLSSFLRMTEIKFFKKYISRFEKEVPELLSLYQGKSKMNGLDPSV